MSDTENENNRVIHLRLRGKPFAIDDEDVKAFKSDFLTTLVKEDSPFQQPDDGVYVVDADPIWFLVFLHLVRTGGIPFAVSSYDEESWREIFAAADFWGIRDSVSTELAKLVNARKEGYNQGCTVTRLEHEVVESKKHHNFRRDDGSGRVYCVDCGNRDIDSRFYEEKWRKNIFSDQWYCEPASKYTNCNKCKVEILYKPNLYWCHKCRMCEKCQGYKSCPADYVTINRGAQKGPTTADKAKELAKALSKAPAYQGSISSVELKELREALLGNLNK